MGWGVGGSLSVYVLLWVPDVLVFFSGLGFGGVGGGWGGLVTSGSPAPYVRGVRSRFMFFCGCLMYWCSFQGWGLGGWGGGLGGVSNVGVSSAACL